MPEENLADKGQITDEIVDEFYSTYIRQTGLGADSEEVVHKQLVNAYDYVCQVVGVFDITKEPVGKMLVFDRARYVRANATELFYPNYLPDLNGFALYLGRKRWEGKNAKQES